jgi:hypothetical protein
MVNKNIYKDTQIRSSETIAEELSRLREYSEQNNINEVNNCVDSLLRNPEFWTLCYESIKSNPGESSLAGKAVTMDGINLEFFHKLSINIPKGRFNFGPIRKIDIPKPQGGVRPLGIDDSRDKIVQKGMAVILEELSEHRFLDCSFGFRRGRSCHDAITYIKRKVPSGMWVGRCGMGRRARVEGAKVSEVMASRNAPYPPANNNRLRTEADKGCGSTQYLTAMQNVG